ncbi:MAG: hypothetical protein AAB459_03380 [Patescibacteria group bacterium]
MCGLFASDAVRDAAAEWDAGNHEKARYILCLARETLSMARICQLLGIERTRQIYGLVIVINRGKSVRFIEYAS